MDKHTSLNLERWGTQFIKGKSYLIKELTFQKRWINGRYSHKEDEYFVFDAQNDEYYRINDANCLNSLYEITINNS